MNKIKVMIVDDHPAVRLGLQSILNKFEDIDVVAVAENGEKARLICQQHMPNVALVDMFMPGLDGIETLHLLQTINPELHTIMLTHSDNSDDIMRALDAGALGYLIKNSEINIIADGIRAAAVGHRVLSQEALEAIVQVRTSQAAINANNLTEREQDVLNLMAQGLKNPQIAEKLVITLSTVKFHISTIFRKLGVETRTEAVVSAMNKGLVPPKSETHPSDKD